MEIIPPRAVVWDPTIDDFDHATWHEVRGFVRMDLPPGSATWGRDEGNIVHRIHYICPCGCGDFRSISVSKQAAPHNWLWDGDEVKPTLAPSIKHLAHRPGDCDWHGHLQAGVWVTADSGIGPNG